ncbi:putative glutamate-cysteine ligase modifier subunit [Rosellinia necatrix]|uniref:GCS light chain n=1 Tax=Rosellinia necatrix TaxID=77044 RepID=A0A1S7UN44_ROSNE|nr:putative glutamate-cysteine ligase modifier subunit [Rosellinia necatrix]
MTRIVLSTGNIVTDGPSLIRKPGATRSNLELTNSLRSSFQAAQQDYASYPPGRNGNGAHAHGNGGSVNGDGRPALDAWTATEDSILYVPRIDWAAAGLQEDRAQYEITLKLFFLPSAPASQRARYVEEALRLVRKELRIEHIDLLIVSFPGVSFEGDCEWQADKLNATMGNDEEEVMTWSALESLYEQGIVSRLGIAEFGTEKLQRFINHVKVRPAVDQINTKDCCSVPPPLTKLAKSEGIELLTHGDCTDILPSGTLRELLGHGAQGAGVLADDENAQNGLQGNLIPQWVAKYTAFVSYRGVIENKGYFAGAELV